MKIIAFPRSPAQGWRPISALTDEELAAVSVEVHADLVLRRKAEAEAEAWALTVGKEGREGV